MTATARDVIYPPDLMLKLAGALTAVLVAMRVWWHRQMAKWQRMDRLEERVDANQGEIRRLDDVVNVKTEEIHTLQRKVAELTRQNTDQQHQLDDKQGQLDDKQGQIDKLNQQLVVVTRERDEAVAAVAELIRQQGK